MSVISHRAVSFNLCVGLAFFWTAVFLAGFGMAQQDAKSKTVEVTSTKAPQDDAAAQDKTANKDQDKDQDNSELEVLAGHSYHGDAFNEGPRQKAYLMGGTGEVHFEVTTSEEMAQKFFDQGIGQIHGFWDLEAERSFRQVAAIDEDCAMAYWGMALATIRNKERSKGFIAEAVKRKKKVSDREQKYITALDKYINHKSDDKKVRAAAYLRDLESIVLDFPNDVEAKALVAHRIWHNSREGIPVASYLATDALLNDIYKVNPMHPAHHYTIHLWDYRKPERAVESAEKCGASAHNIAHMWHMPGHIYSRLKKYETAVYQQEASARVDHNHMIRDRVMPDEISNYAHNNEWLIRNLVFVGRVKDSLALARNMIELPQHPKYNTLEKRGGSASYGRRRLLQVLREYQLYDDAVQLCESPYLSGAEDPAEEVKRLRLLGSAAAMTAEEDLLQSAKSQLKAQLQEERTKQEELETKIKLLKVASDKSADRPPRPIDMGGAATEKDASKLLNETKPKASKAKSIVKQIEKALKAIDGYEHYALKKYEAAAKLLKEAAGEDLSLVGELQVLAGNEKEGMKILNKQIERRPEEVLPLARLAFVQDTLGKSDEAKKTLERLRDCSTSIDIDIPVFARLESLALKAGFDEHWLKHSVLETNTAMRPELDTLGPLRWTPPTAPAWTLTDGDQNEVASQSLTGRPVLMIFYLGHGCLHCAEQLKAFGPRVPDFEKAGIDIIAVSSDSADKLGLSIKNYGSELPFKMLLADGDLEVFKKFRAYDDFEQQPLHGTFLIDAEGKIRWQDISYEPFMEHEFLLKESQRLLSQSITSQMVDRKETLEQHRKTKKAVSETKPKESQSVIAGNE